MLPRRSVCAVCTRSGLTVSLLHIMYHTQELLETFVQRNSKGNIKAGHAKKLARALAELAGTEEDFESWTARSSSRLTPSPGAEEPGDDAAGDGNGEDEGGIFGLDDSDDSDDGEYCSC